MPITFPIPTYVGEPFSAGGKTKWPLPEGTYAVKRNEADFSKIKYKEQEE